MGIVKSKEINWNLKGHFAKLKKDLEPMTFKEKVDHIWTYYKEYMLVIFCVLVIIGGLLVSVLTPKPHILFAGVQCNVRLTTEGYDYLTKGFQQDVLDGAEGNMFLHTLRFYGEGTVEAVEETTQAYYSVTSYVEAKELDYMLVDLYAFRYFGSDRLYMDLRQVLSEQELQELDQQGLLLYEQNEGETEKTPRAINISQTAFCKSHLGGQECYLVFIRNSPRAEHCEKMWDYIKKFK